MWENCHDAEAYEQAKRAAAPPVPGGGPSDGTNQHDWECATMTNKLASCDCFRAAAPVPSEAQRPWCQVCGRETPVYCDECHAILAAPVPSGRAEALREAAALARKYKALWAETPVTHFPNEARILAAEEIALAVEKLAALSPAGPPEGGERVPTLSEQELGKRLSELEYVIACQQREIERLRAALSTREGDSR